VTLELRPPTISTEVRGDGHPGLDRVQDGPGLNSDLVTVDLRRPATSGSRSFGGSVDQQHDAGGSAPPDGIESGVEDELKDGGDGAGRLELGRESGAHR
jgi:hypothetical protein